MASLSIQLLGEFKLLYTDEVITIPHAREKALLAYLLLHRTAPQARQHLAFLFWPDSGEAQARRNLRKALSHLRDQVPSAFQFLQIDRHTVQWRIDAPYTLDVAEFEQHLVLAASLAHDPDQQRVTLTKAVVLYQGDLLPSCYDDWIVPVRERLRRALIEALEKLVWLTEDRREYEVAIRHAHHLLRVDPLHETTYQYLMRLYALNGDRAAALQVYHTCVTLLQRELGVEPGEVLQQAHAQLLAAAIPASLRPKSPPAMRSAPRLVGRQAEWQQLRAAWQQTVRGQTHFCLIYGEAGIGKTRLGEELINWAARQGIVTATTRSYAAEGALAYAPVIEWLHTPPLQAALAKLESVWLTEVARLLPELLVEYPTLPQPAPLTDQRQRQRLFEALARAFTSDGHPKLLVIDDLQWCDGETLAWLHYLLRFGHSANGQLSSHLAPLLLVGTARSEEVDANHPLTTLLLDLHRYEKVTELTLTPLNATETAALAAQVTAAPLSEETAQAVFRQSEGNPLFVVEMVRAGVQVSTTESVSLAPTDTGVLPSRVQAVIHYRLNQLTAAAHHLVGLAATIGRAFTFALLVAVSGVPEAELVQSLDELWQRGLIRTQGVNIYDFSHDRIREEAYAELSPVQRPLWHKRVAQALETLHADDLGSVSAQLAMHYERAGLLPQAVNWYQRAAHVAKQLFVHTEAIAHLESGLALLDRRPQGAIDVAQKIQLLLQLDEAMTYVYGVAFLGREDILLQVRELATQIHHDNSLSNALSSLSFFYQAHGEIEAARKLAQAHLLRAQRTDEPFQHALAYLHCGLIAMSSGTFKDANQALEQAHLSLNRCGERVRQQMMWKHHRSSIDRFWLNILWIAGFPDQAQETAQRMFWLAPELIPSEYSNIPFFAAILYRNLKLNQPLAQQVNDLTRMGETYSIRLVQQSSMVFQGWMLTHQGALSEGIALTRRGVASFRSVGHTMFQTHRLAMLVEMHLMAKQFGEAQAVLDEAFAISKGKGEHFWDVELYRLQGDLLLAQDAPAAQAEQVYLQAIATAQQQAAKSLELRAAIRLCRLWQRQDRHTEAQDLLATIYGWFTEGFDTADLQEAKALLSELA